MKSVKPAWRDVHGILLLDKPPGVSSNGALQVVRRLFLAAKAGHTGSLDPLATGLLPICFGEATKIAGLLLGSRKAYETECRLGATTTTDDAEGELIEQRAVSGYDDAMIVDTLAMLTGRITQVPPIYSALKQAGVPLYKRARRGEQVEAPPRAVDVYRFELLENANDRLRLHVECGSGTYVRSLVRDLGERLGCGAHVTALRRLWIEPFRTPRMYTIWRVIRRYNWTRRARRDCVPDKWSRSIRRRPGAALRWTKPAVQLRSLKWTWPAARARCVASIHAD